MPIDEHLARLQSATKPCCSAGSLVQALSRGRTCVVGYLDRLSMSATRYSEATGPNTSSR